MAPVEFPVPTYPSLESLPIDSPVRKLYPDDVYPNGKYYPSPLGRVRYWIFGPEDGEKVVFIHGISTPCYIFKYVVEVVAKAGFQVLLYDLYGRGYSESPKETIATNDYITQLALLLQYAGWQKTYVVGLSMGGGIAAAFAAMFPHLVKGKVVLLASAGLLELSNREEGKSAPPVNLTKSSGAVLESQIVGQMQSLQREQLPGYGKVLQDSLKCGPVAGLKWAFEALATVQTANGPLKLLVIHGTNDVIVPYTEAGKIQALVPQAKLVTLEGAGHYLVGEEGHWQVAARNIVEFLST